jgi:Ser/Thr protein kinase RdoA (MazF antagonist)
VLRVMADDRTRAEHDARCAAYAAAQGLGCAEPIAWRDGRAIVSFRHGAVTYYALLFEHVDGRYPSTVDDLERVGRALARFHASAPGPMATIPCPYTAVRDDQVPRAISRIASTMPSRLMSRLHAYLDAETCALCHGQLYRTNILVRRGVVHFIDFETAGMGSPLLDLGGACFGILTSERVSIDRRRATAFLRGYSAESHHLPRQAAPIACAAALFGLRTAVWRFNLRPRDRYEKARHRRWPDALRAVDAWYRLADTWQWPC